MSAMLFLTSQSRRLNNANIAREVCICSALCLLHCHFGQRVLLIWTSWVWSIHWLNVGAKFFKNDTRCKTVNTISYNISSSLVHSFQYWWRDQGFNHENFMNVRGAAAVQKPQYVPEISQLLFLLCPFELKFWSYTDNDHTPELLH